MKTRAALLAAFTAAAALALTGCGSGGDGYGNPAPSPSGASVSAGGDGYGGGYGNTPTSASLTLKAATVAGKTIVVDGKGNTVYIFTPDGMSATKSACAGSCAAMWPAVEAESAPALQGVTAKAGTITGTNGKMQVTVNGMPIYYFAHDTAPGQVNGQGVNGVWYVLGADGNVIKDSLK